jgi:hypothetical protein
MRLFLCAVTVVILQFASSAQSTPPPRKILINISNPSDQPRFAEDIVVSFASLRKLAPDINAGSLLVMAPGNGPSATEIQLPSQVDDLDGDGKADELIFQINLKPKQTRAVTIVYGEPDQIYRQRNEYPKRTYALFANKIEGLGWESGKNAWRLYFDPRNAIDLYGKRRDSMFLDFAATPEYAYHADTINGRDIFRIGGAIGIGAVGAWVDGKLIKVADVSERRWKIISSGPVRSIIDVTYDGWKVEGKNINLHSRIVQWAGDRGFFYSIDAQDARGITFLTGLTRHDRTDVFRSEANVSPSWLATYGEQVTETGPTPTQELKGTNLGLAVIFLDSKTWAAQDDLNYLMTFSLSPNGAHWYVAAAWDQEGMNNGVAFGAPAHKPVRTEDHLPALKTQKDFLGWVEQRKAELTTPSIVTLSH